MLSIEQLSATWLATPKKSLSAAVPSQGQQSGTINRSTSRKKLPRLSQ